MHYRTQQGHEQTWGFSRLGGTGYQNTLINNNITNFFSDEFHIP